MDGDVTISRVYDLREGEGEIRVGGYFGCPIGWSQRDDSWCLIGGGGKCPAGGGSDPQVGVAVLVLESALVDVDVIGDAFVENSDWVDGDSGAICGDPAAGHRDGGGDPSVGGVVDGDVAIGWVDVFCEVEGDVGVHSHPGGPVSRGS